MRDLVVPDTFLYSLCCNQSTKKQLSIHSRVLFLTPAALLSNVCTSHTLCYIKKNPNQLKRNADVEKTQQPTSTS